MKKSVLRLGKILSAIVIAAVVMFTGTNTVNGAANSIKVGTVTTLPGYVAGVKFHIKPLQGGGYAYCLNIHKETASNVTEYLDKEMDAGVAYILENGYPNKSFTGEKKKDFYITQGALWWYLDDTTGTANLGDGFKKTGSDEYGLRKYMKKLVSGAKDAKKAGFDIPLISPTLNGAVMSLSGSNFVSSKITVKESGFNAKYKVEIYDAPKGAYTTDVDGNKKSKFDNGEKFKVVVPESSVKDGQTESVKMHITSTAVINKAYKYTPKNSSIQPMTVLQPSSKEVSAKVVVRVKKESAPMCKFDETTNTYYGKNGNVVTKEQYIQECLTPKACSYDSSLNTYFGKDGRIVTKEVYEDECLPKRYCEYDATKNLYYGINGNVVTKDQYDRECNQNLVTIYKVDKNTNDTVAGASMIIRDMNGNQVLSFLSTANGNNITGLANGTYTVEEQVAPKGYELSNEKQQFTLSDTSKIVRVYFYNTPKARTIIINKVDSNTGKPVAGAVIVVRDANGTEVARFTSSNQAYVMNNVANGTYTVKEESAPEGYLLNTEEQRFTIDDEHNSHQVTIKNVPKTCENTPEECQVVVPDTGSSSLPFYLIGIAIIGTGLGYVYKKNKANQK